MFSRLSNTPGFLDEDFPEILLFFFSFVPDPEINAPDQCYDNYSPWKTELRDG